MQNCHERVYFWFFNRFKFNTCYRCTKFICYRAGIKKNNIFLVTSICIVGDFLLIFFGIFIFHFIKNFINDLINLLLSIGLVLFLLNFIWSKIKTFKHDIVFSQTHTQTSKSKIALQTLAFTFLNHTFTQTLFLF